MNTATSTDTDERQRSVLNRLSVFCLALTTGFLTASVFLIFQYKQGIPFSFTTSVLLAAAAALVIPFVTAYLFRRYFPTLSYPGMVGYSIGNLVIAVGTGLFIF